MVRLLAAVALAAAAPAPGPAAPGSPAAVAEYRALLAALVAADTSNPPGNEARAVAIGAARLREAGIPFQVFEFASGRADLVARLKGDGSATPLLLLAHVDVVGTAGQPWSTPPHTVTEREGYLYGRGVSDDLGMAAAELEVLLSLKRDGTPLRRDVILAWTGDEESGGAGIRWLLEHQRAAIEAGLVLNEGGGPMLDEVGRPKLFELQAAEKTYQDFTLRTHGTTGHSSVPKGVNAIVRLSRALERIGGYRFPIHLLPVTRAYLTDRAGRENPELAAAIRAVLGSPEPPAQAVAALDVVPELAATVRTTCVVTQIAGGTRQNALPAEATANVNCRILPDEGPPEVQRKLAEIVGDPAVVIEPAAQFGQAGPSPLEGEGPDAIRRVAARFWPGAPVVPYMSRGASDSRHLRALGIPCYGIDGFAMTEADASRAHGIDERVPVASLGPGLAFFHALVLELAARAPR